MGFCCCMLKPRCFFLFLCYIQLLSLFARQGFDLFGHLWTCVLVNFFTILIVIVGIFGGHRRSPSYVVIYFVWQLLSIIWNAFLICFYLDLGPYTLSNAGDFNLINLGTGSRSWFEANGHGCNASYNISDLSDHLQLIKPVQVNGCHFDYRIIECVQAGLQILLSINNTCISFFLMYLFSLKKSEADHIYGEQIGGPTPLDTALPPYSRTMPNRTDTLNHRSGHGTNHQSMRKSRRRSSTRSTKSHRSNRRARSAGRSEQSNGTLSTTTNASIGAVELYATYGKRRAASIRRTSMLDNHHNYGSSSQLQAQMADSSSLDSYAGRSNHAYQESHTSLHKMDQTTGNYGTNTNYVANGNYVTNVNYSSNANYASSDYRTNATTVVSQPHLSTMTLHTGQQPHVVQQPMGSLSALSGHSRHEAIYNIYSSNPYNTYGRSMSRPQQRPSSFCSNSSINSGNLTNYGINPNPSAGSTFHNPNRPSSRSSPIYMNSETRI